MISSRKDYYTVHDHVIRLKEALSKDEIDRLCIGACCGSAINACPWALKRCKMCLSFLDLFNEEWPIRSLARDPREKCPCFVLGKEEAVSRTLLKIAEYEEQQRKGGVDPTES